MTAQAAIDEVVDRIAARFSPERIVLFGSHARGDAREGSDLDLMVLFREVDDPRERAAELYAALIDSHLPTDIVVSTTARFERYKNVVNTVYWPAAREGRVVYGLSISRDNLKKTANERERAKFSKAQKEPKPSSRPAGKAADDSREVELALFMETFGIKSRKVALKLQKQRDKAVEALMKLHVPSLAAKEAVDKDLKDSIAKGKVNLNE